ncbi:glycosyltransferase family 4 protein [Priestia megaterium]|uniref:glycosyltransferase family 4 protein n=1 Tax=Priestia megaterium TaxID=1404 RepID=UPI0039FDCEF3
MKKDVKRKRIVFLIGSMRRGGAERVISILANHYVRNDWYVDILTLLDNTNDYKLDNRINVISIAEEGKSRIKQFPTWLKSIRRYISINKPDRVVSFIARINIITLLSCIGLKQKILISERNDPRADGRSSIITLATKVLYPLADRVVFQTHWAKACFSKKIQNNSIIIPNPVNVELEVSKNTKKKKIIAVGRLVAQKNHKLLIRAFKLVHDKFPQYDLYIYGEGHLREELTSLIKEQGIEQSVFLPGQVANIHEKMAESEIFVLSSNYEGLSNALLEAMSIGLPVVSTNCAGSNEVIRDRENGLMISKGSERELVDAISQLITDAELREKIASGAIEDSKNFKKEKVLKQWVNTIETL